MVLIIPATWSDDVIQTASDAEMVIKSNNL